MLFLPPTRLPSRRCGRGTYLKEVGADDEPVVVRVERQRLGDGVGRLPRGVVAVGARRRRAQRVVGSRPGRHGRLDRQPLAVQLVEPIRGADVQPAGPHVDDQVLEHAASAAGRQLVGGELDPSAGRRQHEEQRQQRRRRDRTPQSVI